MINPYLIGDAFLPFRSEKKHSPRKMLTTKRKRPESAIDKFQRGRGERSIFPSFLQGAGAQNCLDCLGPLMKSKGLALTTAQDMLRTVILRGSGRATDATFASMLPSLSQKMLLFSTLLILLGHWRLGLEAQTLCQAIPSCLSMSCRRSLIKLMAGSSLRKCPLSLKCGWSVNRNS